MRKKIDTDDAVVTTKDGLDKRYFAYYDIGEFAEVLQRSGFTIISSHEKPEPLEPEKIWLCYFAKK